MFKDYKIIKYLGLGQAINKYEYLVQIIDDDFVEEIVVGLTPGQLWGPDPIVSSLAIIKCYSKKQFDVAHNFVLFLLKYKDTLDPNIKINDIIENIDQLIPEFTEYSNKVKQLLLFI